MMKMNTTTVLSAIVVSASLALLLLSASASASAPASSGQASSGASTPASSAQASSRASAPASSVQASSRASAPASSVQASSRAASAPASSVQASSRASAPASSGQASFPAASFAGSSGDFPAGVAGRAAAAPPGVPRSDSLDGDAGSGAPPPAVPAPPPPPGVPAPPSPETTTPATACLPCCRRKTRINKHGPNAWAKATGRTAIAILGLMFVYSLVVLVLVMAHRFDGYKLYLTEKLQNVQGGAIEHLFYCSKVVVVGLFALLLAVKLGWVICQSLGWTENASPDLEEIQQILEAAEEVF